jgi:hypothetical protein
MKSTIEPEKFTAIARAAADVSELMQKTGLSRAACWNRICRYRRAGVKGFDHFRGDHAKIAELGNGSKIAESSRDAEIDITDENY